jgi:hypothetical protein
MGRRCGGMVAFEGAWRAKPGSVCKGRAPQRSRRLPPTDSRLPPPPCRRPACRLEEVAAKEEDYQETLLCVNRLWEELNASIGFIQYRWGRWGVWGVGGGGSGGRLCEAAFGCRLR